jgi:twitching motility protein PilT
MLDPSARPADAVRVILDLLNQAVSSGASDVILKSGRVACMRVGEELRPFTMEPLAPADLAFFVRHAAPPALVARWNEDRQADFAYTSGTQRFRVNAFQQRGTTSLIFRLIRAEVPKLAELGLHRAEEVLGGFARARDGIVLVCGATGTGKSTTLAAIIDAMNRQRPCHIVTLEDPIEYAFRDDRAVIQQREIGIDVPSYRAGLEAVLRQSPDVILIGELRDRETLEVAMTAAETGHLVLTTLHAGTALQALARLVEFFPLEEAANARRAVAAALRGLFCQKLLPRSDSRGYVPATEALGIDATTRSLVAAGQLEKVQALLEGGPGVEHWSFNRDLYRLWQQGLVTQAEALRCSPNPAQLEMNFRGIFVRS